jgi:hypothetical protein
MMLADWARTSTDYGPFWLWGIICFALVGVSYVIGRVLGTFPLLLVSIILPATLIIHPMGSGSSSYDVAGDDDSSPVVAEGLAGGDLQQFAKGAAVFAGLAALTAAAYVACHSVTWIRRSRHWPPRRPATAALIVAGLVALAMLRIATRSWPGPPWQRSLAHFFGQSGWPQAICLWLWMAVAYLLARYDTEVLPYLLHRMGQDWAPPWLSLADVHWVDQLMAGLKHPTSKGRSQGKRRRHGSR